MTVNEAAQNTFADPKKEGKPYNPQTLAAFKNLLGILFDAEVVKQTIVNQNYSSRLAQALTPSFSENSVHQRDGGFWSSSVAPEVSYESLFEATRIVNEAFGRQIDASRWLGGQILKAYTEKQDLSSFPDKLKNCLVLNGVVASWRSGVHNLPFTPALVSTDKILGVYNIKDSKAIDEYTAFLEKVTHFSLHSFVNGLANYIKADSWKEVEFDTLCLINQYYQFSYDYMCSFAVQNTDLSVAELRKALIDDFNPSKLEQFNQ